MKQWYLTIDPLAEFYNISEFHRFAFLCSEMREYARTESDIFIEVTLCETIVTKLKFGRFDVGQICIENAQWVKFCEMMTTDLVCTDKKLNLYSISHETLDTR